MPQQKDNSGVLFKNTKKTKTTQPDYTGNVTIQGIDYRLAAWVKQGKHKFFSLSFTEKTNKAKEPTTCGNCEFDEAEGLLINQCANCQLKDKP